MSGLGQGGDEMHKHACTQTGGASASAVVQRAAAGKPALQTNSPHRPESISMLSIASSRPFAPLRRRAHPGRVRCRLVTANAGPPARPSRDSGQHSAALIRRRVLAIEAAVLGAFTLSTAFAVFAEESDDFIALNDPVAVEPVFDAPTPPSLPTEPVFEEMAPLAPAPVPVSSSDAQLSESDAKLLAYNQKIHEVNGAPADFPAFIREGYKVRVLTPPDYTVRDDGLIFKDFAVGRGMSPVDGQEVVFEYTAYNENGGRIDSTKKQGRPARTRVGIQGMIPGFEQGILTMKPGGRRRIVVPPELGPPVGPSTFFSARQFEVFDVDLLEVNNCVREGFALVSKVVCKPA